MRYRVYIKRVRGKEGESGRKKMADRAGRVKLRANKKCHECKEA